MFVSSYVWQSPSLAARNPVLRAVAGGWEVSGVIGAQSGGPLTIYAGKDQSLTGSGKEGPRVAWVNGTGRGAFIRPPPSMIGGGTIFRATALNGSNNIRSPKPVTTVTGAGFGHILSANDPRIVQLALKIFF